MLPLRKPKTFAVVCASLGLVVYLYGKPAPEVVVKFTQPPRACVETRLPIQHDAVMIICGKTVSDIDT